MPRASAEDAARTAERVLTTAHALFSERGYAAVSVEDVAVAAGVTRGAVYHHFADKRGLFRAVAVRAHAQVARSVVEAAGQVDDPREQLRVGCHAFVDRITSAGVTRLLLAEAPVVLGWSEWRAMDEAASGRELRDALTELVDPADVDALTRLLTGALNEAALWLADQPGDGAATSVHRQIDRLLDPVVR